MMIFYISFFYFINRIQLQVLATPQTQESNGASMSFNTKIMCDYRGGFDESSSLIPNTDPSCLPHECEMIVYSRFQIDSLQQIDVDFEALKKVKSLNKPVIVSLRRRYDYNDWVDLLSENGNEKDAKVLCDFARDNCVDGFLLRGMAPRCYDTLNSNFTKYVPAYLKQLKCHENFIIGISVEGFSAFIKNPCVYDFANMNSLVNFYELHTFALNSCDPKVYNGRIPLLTRKHGADYLSSMEEVGLFAKASQISYDKVVYTIEMFPINSDVLVYTSYHQVCTGPIECDKWCIQTTKDFFDKAAFVKKENCGVIVKWVDLDDVQNACKCGPFIGFKNIVAGYTGGQLQSCAKFDIQANFLHVPE